MKGCPSLHEIIVIYFKDYFKLLRLLEQIRVI